MNSLIIASSNPHTHFDQHTSITDMKLTGNITLLASLGVAEALNPSCAPGGNFDLSKWELQLPIGNGSPQIVAPAQLVGCSGYQDPGHHYFFTETGDGALVMKAPGSPAKTGCVKFAESDHVCNPCNHFLPVISNPRRQTFPSSVMRMSREQTELPKRGLFYLKEFLLTLSNYT